VEGKYSNLLNAALEKPITSPRKWYIHKLADEAEQLNTHHILHEREVDNLQSIIQKRRECKKSKRVISKGQFLISIEDIRLQVIEAEAATAASQKLKKLAQLPTTTTYVEVIDDDEDEEVIEKPYNSNLDELG
jgi:uncharacterized protein (DUF3084 family)